LIVKWGVITPNENRNQRCDRNTQNGHPVGDRGKGKHVFAKGSLVWFGFGSR
jgi:hypothetical protein